jgi:ParB family chromosome partitioning protein
VPPRKRHTTTATGRASTYRKRKAVQTKPATSLDLDWLKLPADEGFAVLAALSADAKHRLFAWCIASCLKPQLAIEDRADPVIESAGRRLTIPFADCWRPTAANYWGRVKSRPSPRVPRRAAARNCGQASAAFISGTREALMRRAG